MGTYLQEENIAIHVYKNKVVNACNESGDIRNFIQ